MLPSHIGERAFIKTACKWWLVSVLIKIQPHVRYSAGANPLLLPLLPSSASRKTYIETCIRTLTADPPLPPPSFASAWPRSHSSAEYGWFKGSLQMGRLQVETKSRDKSRRSRLKVSTKPIQLGGGERQNSEKYTHTLSCQNAFGLSWVTVKAGNIREWTEIYKINKPLDVVGSYDAS